MSRLDKVEKAEEVKTGKRKAFIAFVLDESGSMSTGREATIVGMNEQIQQVKSTFKDNADVEPVVTFVKFNGEVKPIFVNKGLDELREITEQDYQPNGGTAMYDGVGFVMNALEQHPDISDASSTVLVVVVSDGEENSSQEFTSEKIAEKVKGYNETKRWKFTYLGANQDLGVVSQRTGVLRGNTASFSAQNAQGYSAGFNTHNIALASYLCDVSDRSLDLESLSVKAFYAGSGSESKSGSSTGVAGSSTVSSTANSNTEESKTEVPTTV